MKPTPDSQSFRAERAELVDRYLQTIVHLVANHFQIPVRLLRDRDGRPNGPRRIAEVRYLCYALSRQFTGLTTDEIGRFYHRAHHPVLHGLERFSEIRSVDYAYNKSARDCETALRLVFCVAQSPNPPAAFESFKNGDQQNSAARFGT